MSADTIPAGVVDILRGEIGTAMDVTEDGTAMSDPNFELAVEGVFQAVIRVLTDRSTRPAEPAAPVAEVGDGDVSRYIAKCREMSKGENGHTYTWWSRLADLLSTLEAERARADAAEQRAADALALVKELEFGAGFEAAFDAVVRPGSRYENWMPADDPAEIVTDLYNDLEDALARAEKGEDWQPIRTAPMGKNGIAFMMLAFGPPGDQTVSEGMHFNGRFYAASVFHQVNPSDGRHFVFREHEVRPTHWRPTLAPPRAAREAQPATDGGDNG